MEITKSLCYSNEKGLYTLYLLEEEYHDDLLFRPYEKKGRKSTLVETKDKKLKIQINSNFDFGRSSYLTAKVFKQEYVLLDFDIEKLYVHQEACGVEFFSVPTKNWNLLFEKIMRGYNIPFTPSCPASAIGYLDEIKIMLDTNKANIKMALHDEKPQEWKEMVLLSHIGDKICNFLEGIAIARITDETIIKHTMDLCTLFLMKLKGISIKRQDLRTPHFAKVLFAIHSFMNRNNAGVDFLYYFISNEIKN